MNAAIVVLMQKRRLRSHRIGRVGYQTVTRSQLGCDGRGMQACAHSFHLSLPLISSQK